MKESKKVPIALVYYRDMPEILQCFVNAQKGYSISKDGVTRDLDHQCPRMTIWAEYTGQKLDEGPVKRLDKLLSELTSNNQISGFVIKIKYKKDISKKKL